MRSLLMFAALAPELAINWQQRAPLPLPQAGAAAGWLNGELVLAGGTVWENGKKRFLRDVQIYNPETGTWRAGTPLPEPLAYGPAVTTPHGLKIYGGVTGERTSNRIWLLDNAKEEWREQGRMPVPAVLGRAAHVRNATYFFGGCPDAADIGRCSSAVWQRSFTGAWVRPGSIPNGALALPAVATVGDDVYLFGGCSQKNGVLRNHAEARRYHVPENQWHTLAPLPEAFRGAGAVALNGRYILILGGYAADFRAQVLVYDIAADKYRETTPLPAGLMGVEFVLGGGFLYGAGGEDQVRHRSGRLLVAPVPEWAQ